MLMCSFDVLIKTEGINLKHAFLHLQKYCDNGGNMLFDNNELSRVFTSDGLVYFNEILQSYYNKSYRSAVVLLYSFLCYDLFNKLKKMAEEGDPKAAKELSDLSSKISDYETKYSEVESQIINYFLNNFSTYFNRFKEDISYLKECRHKCAHLRINDDELYHPKDYQVKMLILSMYENVFTKKAPFINDIFEIAKSDIEKYNDSVYQYIDFNDMENKISKKLEFKYYNRMNEQSFENSLRTFIKLLFVSTAEESAKYSGGLYIFTDSLINYMLKNGFSDIFYKAKISKTINEIDLEDFTQDKNKSRYLKLLMNRHYQFRDLIYNKNIDIYNYILDQITRSSNSFLEFKNIFNIKEKSLFSLFKENINKVSIDSFTGIYNGLEKEEDFDKDEMLIMLFKKVPTYNAFYEADRAFSLLLDQVSYLKIETIKKLLTIYCNNRQFTNRNAHFPDIKRFIKTLDEMEVSIDYSEYPEINRVYNIIKIQKENEKKLEEEENEEEKVLVE